LEGCQGVFLGHRQRQMSQHGGERAMYREVRDV
jgi:hypothetical protein